MRIPSVLSSASHPLGQLFYRYYWLQIALIAFAVVMGIGGSAFIIKGLLLKTALQQEMAHYWHRVDQNPQANLPDTKNLYGYRWNTTEPPANLQHIPLQNGVHRIPINGKERMTVYEQRQGQHVLLVFGESNVNRLVWLFGLAPLMLSLFVLYSVLWWFNQRARRHVSPIDQLAKALQRIDWDGPYLTSPSFEKVATVGNVEAEHLKQALVHYHHTVLDFIKREQQFTGDVSHELRTPLAVLRGNVQLCQSRYGQDKALTRLLNTIDDMQLLVDTLLAVARKKTQAIPQQQVQLSELLQQLVDDVQPLATARNMQIKLSLVTEATRQLNTAMACMVFNNIIRNALNYSEGRTLDIVLDGQRVIIADDGIGLTGEVRELLTNPALIDDDAQQYTPKGHGIGLQLVQRLCSTLNWRVELYDRMQIDSLNALHRQDSDQKDQTQKKSTQKGLAVVVYLNS